MNGSRLAHRMPLPAEINTHGPCVPSPCHAWVRVAFAFGMAPLVTFLLLDSLLSQALTWWAATFNVGLQDGSTLHAMRMALRVGLPAALLMALLYFTRLGEWLVIPRLALALVLIESASLLLHLTQHTSLYVLSGNGLVPGNWDRHVVAVGTACMVASACLVVAATAWHRSRSVRLLIDYALSGACQSPAPTKPIRHNEESRNVR
jgi:hypothetical protein